MNAKARSVSSGAVLAALATALLLAPSCEWDGHFTLLGYTTRPNFDTCYKTVKVNIFKNPTFWSVLPVPGMEMELTQALVREIEQRTPYKVVQDNADTEIIGNIKSFNKAILSYNQLFEVRECETTLVVEVLWRDLRTGKILTMPTRLPGAPLPTDTLPPPPGFTDAPGASQVLGPTPSTPTSPLNTGFVSPPTGSTQGVAALPATAPTSATAPLAYQLVRSVAHFRPELGESLATAQKKNFDRMAEQIVNMMETPW